jgi:hypothetical protein
MDLIGDVQETQHDRQHLLHSLPSLCKQGRFGRCL